MIERPYTISAKELFGELSHLVALNSDEMVPSILSLGVIYQVVASVAALLFVFVLVRYFDQFQHLLFSFASKSTKQSDGIHIYAAEIRNIEIFMSIVGFSLISLLVVRFSIMPQFATLLSSICGLPTWVVVGVSFGALLTLVLMENGALYLTGVISEQSEFCNNIWQLKLRHFSATAIILTPLLILILLTEGFTTKISLYISVAVCSVSLILFVKESFLLFRAQRFSIFHWILYLCALEIFPLSLLMAPILRG